MVSKRDDVYEQLRNAILRGGMRPGDVISEREVAESLGASRVPLREAVIQLERDGLVMVVPRRGAFVRTFTAVELQHLYELREAVEGLAAARAAVRLPPAEMTPHIRAFRSELRAKRLDPVASERLGVDFHEAVLQGCGNPLVAETSVRIRDQVQLAKRTSYRHADAEWLRRGAQEHLDIAEAVASGDSAEAERQMKSHIAGWSRYFRSQLDDYRSVPGELGSAR